jgi:hypothetical protein
MRGAITSVEKTISLDSGQALQRTLCVAESGEFGPATRAALRAFNTAQLYPRDAGASETIATDADLRRLRATQAAFPSCRDAGFRNAFEVGIYSRYGSAKMRSDLTLALRVAQLPVPAGLEAVGGPPIDAAVRRAIGDLRTKYGIPGEPAFDRSFYDAMMNNLAR